MFTSIFGLKGKSKKNLQHIITEYLNNRNFRFEIFDNGNTFIVPLSGDNGHWKTGFFIDEEREVLKIHSFCPVKVKDNQKIRIAELVTRINRVCYFGCFIMDFIEGELIYKTIHLCLESEISLNVVDILFNTNVQTLDEYIPAITAVNSGFSDPYLAIQ